MLHLLTALPELRCLHPWKVHQSSLWFTYLFKNIFLKVPNYRCTCVMVQLECWCVRFSWTPNSGPCYMFLIYLNICSAFHCGTTGAFILQTHKSLHTFWFLLALQRHWIFRLSFLSHFVQRLGYIYYKI